MSSFHRAFEREGRVNRTQKIMQKRRVYILYHFASKTNFNMNHQSVAAHIIVLHIDFRIMGRGRMPFRTSKACQGSMWILEHNGEGKSDRPLRSGGVRVYILHIHPSATPTHGILEVNFLEFREHAGIPTFPRSNFQVREDM
jgi:hypothetical protein